MYNGNRNSEIFDPNALRLTKIKPNEIFNDFTISRDPIDAIDLDFCYFKGIDYKITQDPIGSDRT